MNGHLHPYFSKLLDSIQHVQMAKTLLRADREAKVNRFGSGLAPDPDSSVQWWGKHLVEVFYHYTPADSRAPMYWNDAEIRIVWIKTNIARLPEIEVEDRLFPKHLVEGWEEAILREHLEALYGE